MDSAIKLTVESIPTINIYTVPHLYTDDLRQEFIPLFPEVIYFTFLLFPSKSCISHHNTIIYKGNLVLPPRSNNNLHTNLCLLEISSGLGLQPTGTSRKLSSRLSTVTELMWMTWKLGAIPPLCFSLNRDIYYYVTSWFSGTVCLQQSNRTARLPWSSLPDLQWLWSTYSETFEYEL